MRENDDDEARKLTVNEQSTREGRHTWKEHGSGFSFESMLNVRGCCSLESFGVLLGKGGFWR